MFFGYGFHMHMEANKLPAMVLTNIAFEHLKLNLSIKPTGNHLLQKKIRQKNV